MAASCAEGLRVGPSGWHYKHWLGTFYPERTRPANMLAFYQTYFDSAELNNSFYQLPKRPALELWRDSTPPDFRFAVKGSRFLTHMKKLKDASLGLTRSLDAVEVLGEKLGPILFQLPLIGRSISRVSIRFLRCCRPITVTPSNSVTQPGSTRQLTSCSRAITSLTAPSIWPAISHLFSSRPISLMFACTDREASIRAATVTKLSPAGLTASVHGSASPLPSTSISITTTPDSLRETLFA